MPYVVYVWLWVGLALLSMVFGPIWRVLNPIRWLHRGILAPARVSPDFSLARYRAGYWPAALGLFAFTWLELIAPDNDDAARAAGRHSRLHPRLAAARPGLRPRYLDTGDPFEAWSGLYGTLSPLGRRDDRRWVLRTPLHGPNQLASSRACSPPRRSCWAARPTTASPARPGGTPSCSPRPAGPAVGDRRAAPICLVVAGQPVCRGRSLGARSPTCRVRGVWPTRFAPSLVPIAAGYLVAHYWSLWVFEGRQRARRLSDPLGTGANWLGTAGTDAELRLIEPTLVATIQMVAIVTGHLLGVVLAHERA